MFSITLENSVVTDQMASSDLTRGYKTFSCSTQLSTKLQLLIKTKIPTNEEALSDIVFIRLIKVKRPTIVGILTILAG